MCIKPYGGSSINLRRKLTVKIIDQLKQAKNRQRQIHTVKKSVTPTEYNNSNKEIRCYTLTQILDFKQFVI